MTSNSGIIVTYCDEFGLWGLIGKEMLARLPLREVHWKAASLPAFIANTSNYSNRTKTGDIMIPLLNLNLLSFNATGSTTDSNSSPSIQLKQKSHPYLHMYLVSCDDLETYKSTVKRQIQSWLDLISNKRNQEWLIVIVSKDPVRTSNPRFLIRSATIFDRIRADFSAGKRERCAQISLDQINDNDMWQDVFVRIVDGVFFAFGSAVSQLQEDLKRVDAQRNLPGFNFCNFFLMKESLAGMLESMALFEDALVLYDELEASYSVCVGSALQKSAVPWYDNFGCRDALDDSSNILNWNKKPYQEQLAQNTISIFDFRSYLFSRQALLLDKLGLPVNICRSGKLFISKMSIEMTEHYDKLPFPFFIESWIFSSSLNIVAFCDKKYSSFPDYQDSCYSILAELLHDARRQLDKLGRVAGYLSLDYPHEFKFDVENGLKCEWKFSNTTFVNALASRETFIEFYEKLTNDIINRYSFSKSMRIVQILKHDLARLHCFNGKWEQAQSQLIPLVKQVPYVNHVLENTSNSITVTRNANERNRHVWDKISVNLVCLFARTLLEMGDQVGYLATCVLISTFGFGNLDKAEYHFYRTQISTLTKTVKDGSISVDINIIGSVFMNWLPFDSELGSAAIELTIKSSFPDSLAFESIAVTLFGNVNQELKFTSKESITLVPGNNVLKLLPACEISAGQYVAGPIELRSGCLVYESSFIKPNEPKIVIDIRNDSRSIHFEIENASVCDLVVEPSVDAEAELKTDSDMLIASAPFSPIQYAILNIYIRGKSPIEPGAIISLSSQTGLTFRNGSLVQMTVGDTTDHLELQTDCFTIPMQLPCSKPSDLFASGESISIKIPIEDEQWRSMVLSASLRGFHPADIEREHEITVAFKYEVDSRPYYTLSQNFIRLLVPLSWSFNLHHCKDDDGNRDINLVAASKLRCSENSCSGPVVVRSITDCSISNQLVFPGQNVSIVNDLIHGDQQKEIEIVYDTVERLFFQSLASNVGKVVQPLFTNISEPLLPLNHDLYVFVVWFLSSLCLSDPDTKMQLLNSFTVFQKVQLTKPTYFPIQWPSSKQVFIPGYMIPVSWNEMAISICKKLNQSPYQPIQSVSSPLFSPSNIQLAIERFFTSQEAISLQMPPFGTTLGMRSMKITLNLQRPLLVIETRLNLQTATDSTEHQFEFDIGQSIHAELLFNCSIIDSSYVQEHKPVATLEITSAGNEDAWMIMGKRKIKVSLDHNKAFQQHRFNFAIVPLKTGISMLPEAKVKISQIPEKHILKHSSTAGKQVLVKPTLETRSFWIEATQLEQNNETNNYNQSVDSVSASRPEYVSGSTNIATPILSGIQSRGTRSVSNLLSPDDRQPPEEPKEQRQNGTSAMGGINWNQLIAPAVSLGDQVRERVMRQVQRRDNPQFRLAAAKRFLNVATNNRDRE